MNPQFKFASNRDFWIGVGATLIVTILVFVGVPNLIRPRFALYEEKRVSNPGEPRFARTATTESYLRANTMEAVSLGSPADEERKVIHSASIDMLVKDPKQTSEQVRQLAEQAGGFLVSSDTSGAGTASNASLTLRVPVNKFEQFRAELAKLGLQVENEKLEVQDVTKQYIDLSARLRNLRAQEQQYLGILKQARTIKDTVEVSDKLNEVRSQIEQQQGEFEFLSKQVETIALTISLHAEAEAQVFGLHWRPLYQLKVAARDGIDGVGDYAAAMASFVFYIPAILLWLATIVLGLAIAWRILRWLWRILFARREA
jgi:hypothetical protein